MKEIDRITALVGENFRTFGGGMVNRSNPLSIAMQDRPVAFALGVDVRSVVEFVLLETKKQSRRKERKEPTK